MMGYYNKPEATAEAITPTAGSTPGTSAGSTTTGSLHHRPQEGPDRHRRRKNIAPQPIEGRLKSNPFIANAVMLGDRRKFPIALLVRSSTGCGPGPPARDSPRRTMPR